MQKIQYLIIALLCAVAQGAWAQGIYGPTDIYNESDLNWYISNGFRNLVLKADIALNNYVAIGDGKIVTIDLNGHDLGRGLSELTSYGNVIRVETGGTLTIKDSGTGGTITGGYDASGGAICVYGTLTLEGGTITGCNGSEGGAIYVTSDGKFNMKGGTITNCSASRDGGGAIYNKGTVTMSGGTIDGCSATDCGGIYNTSDGTLTISGGTIENNSTTTYGGGGVVNYGAAYITGGIISGNHATTRGGGVWNGEDASLTVTGGTITGNTAGTNGGGLFSNSHITMRGTPIITGNTVGGSTNNLYLADSKQIICDGGAFTSGASISVTLENYGRKFTYNYSHNNDDTAPATNFTMDNSGYGVATIDGEAFAGAVYVERSWEGSNSGGHVKSETKVLTSSYSTISTTNLTGSGWYLLSGENVFNDRITISADVKFILADGSNAEFKKGIRSGNGSTLTIYAQSAGTGTLRATGSGDAANAAIGATENTIGGSLIIHGGTIEASASEKNAAGIGGGDGEGSSMQSIVIWDGTITATGKSSGAGIGGGQHNNTNPSVTIYGGTVTANGGKYGAGIGGGEDRGNGTVKIYGGTVTANGGTDAAGIGGGESGDLDNPVYIYGGTVNASGGEYGAGIGGGENGASGTVTIYSGTVNASGGRYAAGIGGGDNGNNGTVTIYGGTVTSNGGSCGAGIGGGNGGRGGTVTINGGDVNATAGIYSVGIGGTSSATVNINGGTVHAYGKYYDNTGGAGIGVIGGTLYFNMTDGNVTAALLDGGASDADSGNTSGAGIGGCYSHNTTLYITIDGGTVNATGAYGGAGIGAGSYSKSGGDIKSGSTITINGGKVTATGSSRAAGIGAGYGGNNYGTITINGGTVTATGGDNGGAGIGGGREATGYQYGGEGGTIIINGGKVTATATATNDGYDPEAIGNGYHETAAVSLTIANNMCVKYGGSTASSDERVSKCRSAGTRTVEECVHTGNCTDNNDGSTHTVNCTYCATSGNEAHTYGSGLNSYTCSRCSYVMPNPKTVTIYMAKADGSDYGNATTETIQYGTAYTMPECTSVPADMTFVGWDKTTTAPSLTAADSELSSLKAAGDEINITEDVTYYARYQSTVWPGGGNGTASDPYIISTEELWNLLVSSVNTKKVDFYGKYLKMTADVGTTEDPVTEMVGTSKTRFRGNFDGDGHTLNVSFSSSEEACAPFRYTYGATIQNLKTAGTITTSGTNAGGVVGKNFTGSLKLTNVISDVTINSSVSGKACHGGLVGYAINANIEGCAFTGKLLGSGSSQCGGLLGYKSDTSGSNVTIKDCLFLPTEVTVSTSNSYTFGAGMTDKVTVINSFYTTTCGTAQGAKAYTVESGDGLTLDYGGGNNYGNITAYTFDQGDNTTLGGLLYGGLLYTGGTTKVTFTAETSNGKKPTLWAAGGTLTEGSDGSYTLTMASANATVTATGYSNYTVTLYNDPDDVANTSGKTNDETISKNRDRIADVTLSGRTLIKDGKWNTLCLPFDMTATQVSAQLDPSTLMELDVDGTYALDGSPVENGPYKTGFSGSTLYLYFKTATKIEAGKPYIIQWTSGEEWENPIFTSVTISSHAPEAIESADGKVSFVGNFDPVTIGETDDAKHNLYLGAGNTLYYPTVSDFKVNAFRAYFQLHGITAGEPTSGSNGIRAFSLHFGDDSEQTGITTTNYTNFTNSDNSWYSLDGRKLSGKPTAKGIYIYNGKKRVIK